MPPPLRRFAASAPPEAIVAAIREDGGCIVEKMFDASTIAAMRDAVLEKARTSADGVPGSATFGYSTAAETRTEAAQEAGTSYVGENTIRFSSLGKIAPAPFFRMLDNPTYKAVCDAMLLPYCGTYWINTAQAMLIGPNSPAQPLHTDESVWPQVSYRLKVSDQEAPELTVSAMIGLQDGAMTEELGATRVAPFSHLPGAKRGQETVPAELDAGDAMLYSGRTRHAGGANTTPDRWRMALHLSYVVGWLTPEESTPLDYTTAELEEAGVSDHVRQVLGHRSYNPTTIREDDGDQSDPLMGEVGGGGGLWLRNVRRIEDYEFSGEAGERLREPLEPPELGNSEVLLRDDDVEVFIRNGFHVCQPAVPAALHERAAAEIAELLERCPTIFDDHTLRNKARPTSEDATANSNDILRQLPALAEVCDSPTVRGALTSLCGRGYQMQAHRKRRTYPSWLALRVHA